MALQQTVNTGVSCAGPDPEPARPRTTTPPGAWDCHAHVFGPEGRFPYRTPRMYTPPDASLGAYLSMLDVLGVENGVLMQPSIYGADNACLLDAVARSGGRLRGVVVADPRRLDDSTVEDWSRLGVRGVRMSMLAPDILPFSEIEDIGARLGELGWHMSFIPDHSDRIAQMESALRRLRCQLVFEQMGRMKADADPSSPGFAAMKRLLAERKAWVKLSHPYHLTAQGFPYRDTLRLARDCIAAAPERTVWATDWPHALVEDTMPNDGFLLDLLDDWAQDERLRTAILVDNPRRLYDGG